MKIVSVLYAAFGYLVLVAALLWGMVFVGDGITVARMDGSGMAASAAAPFVDLGLLLLMALLYTSVTRGLLRHVARSSVSRWLERSTRAWVAAMGLVLIYVGWQPLPQILWNSGDALGWVLSALFYVGWASILIGIFADHFEVWRVEGPVYFFREPIYYGIVIAVWATPTMTVGHLLLASAATVYSLFDAILAARKTGGAREDRAAASFEGQRLAR